MEYCKEIIETVEKINSTLLEETSEVNEDGITFVSLITNGKEAIIKFAGQTIWSSEDYSFDDPERKPLENLLWCEIQSILRILHAMAI